MCKKWLEEVHIIKDNIIKSNFSNLERRPHVNRHKLSRCYLSQKKRRSNTSKWGSFLKENKYGSLPSSYNEFLDYTHRKGILVTKLSEAHALYKSAPGELMQLTGRRILSSHLLTGQC